MIGAQQVQVKYVRTCIQTLIHEHALQRQTTDYASPPSTSEPWTMGCFGGCQARSQSRGIPLGLGDTTTWYFVVVDTQESMRQQRRATRPQWARWKTWRMGDDKEGVRQRIHAPGYIYMVTATGRTQFSMDCWHEPTTIEGKGRM